ncbi:MAG: hypothetical protein V1922_01105 [bacterium]
MKYAIGQRLTIFEISSCMAMTVKREIQICGELNDKITFHIHGQRKMFYLPKFNESALIFEGWDLPIKYDGEIETQGAYFKTSTSRGNACLNLVGPIETIREYVQSKNLNEKFARFDVVIQIEGEKEIPVFLNYPTQHAVVERIRAQA